jgi:hypothetical protein
VESKKYSIVSVCVCLCVYSIVLVILHVNNPFSAPYSIVLSGLSTSTIFFPYYLKKKFTIFEKETFIEHKICGLIFFTSLSKNSHSEKNSVRYYHIIIHILSHDIMYPIFLADFNGN